MPRVRQPLSIVLQTCAGLYTFPEVQPHGHKSQRKADKKEAAKTWCVGLPSLKTFFLHTRHEKCQYTDKSVIQMSSIQIPTVANFEPNYYICLKIIVICMQISLVQFIVPRFDHDYLHKQTNKLFK